MRIYSFAIYASPEQEEPTKSRSKSSKNDTM